MNPSHSNSSLPFLPQSLSRPPLIFVRVVRKLSLSPSIFFLLSPHVFSLTFPPYFHPIFYSHSPYIYPAPLLFSETFISLYHTNFSLSLSLSPNFASLSSSSSFGLSHSPAIGQVIFFPSFHSKSLSLIYLSLPFILELALSLTPHLIHSNFPLASVPFLSSWFRFPYLFILILFCTPNLGSLYL